MYKRQVYDIPMDTLESLNEAAQKFAPGVVDSHSVLFLGQCNDCLAKHTEQAVHRSA